MMDKMHIIVCWLMCFICSIVVCRSELPEPISGAEFVNVDLINPYMQQTPSASARRFMLDETMFQEWHKVQLPYDTVPPLELPREKQYPPFVRFNAAMAHRPDATKPVGRNAYAMILGAKGEMDCDLLKQFLLLVISLQRTDMASDIVLLATSGSFDRSEEKMLFNHGVRLFYVPLMKVFPNNENSSGFSNRVQYTKLWLWSLYEYDQIFYLDSDMMVLYGHNFDDYFDHPYNLFWQGANSPINGGSFKISPSSLIFEESVRLAVSRSENKNVTFVTGMAAARINLDKQGKLNEERGDDPVEGRKRANKKLATHGGGRPVLLGWKGSIDTWGLNLMAINTNGLKVNNEREKRLMKNFGFGYAYYDQGLIAHICFFLLKECAIAGFADYDHLNEGEAVYMLKDTQFEVNVLPSTVTKKYPPLKSHFIHFSGQYKPHLFCMGKFSKFNLASHRTAKWLQERKDVIEAAREGGWYCDMWNQPFFCTAGGEDHRCGGSAECDEHFGVVLGLKYTDSSISRKDTPKEWLSTEIHLDHEHRDTLPLDREH